MNSTNLVGRLIKDPETRYTSNNTATTSFTLAVNRDFKKDGQPESDFIPIVAWGKTAEFAGKYFAKGLQVAVTGRIQTRNWTDTEGKKHYVTEVVADKVYFADGKRDSGQNAPRPAQSESDDNGFYPMDEDDELPFN